MIQKTLGAVQRAVPRFNQPANPTEFHYNG